MSLTGGVILAVGTRPGIAPGIVAGSLVLLLFSAWRDRVQDLRTVRGLLCRLGVLVGSALAAWAALAAIYPRAFADPFSTLTNATEASSRFRGSGGARSYLPIHLLLDPPLLMVVLVLAGSALFFVRLRTMRTAGDELVGIAVVGAQAGAVPLAAVLSSAYLYNGLRQVLFVLPALAVLATYFVVELVRSTRRDADDRRALAVVVTLVSVALVLPVIGQARLFPYNYTQRGVLLEALGVTAELDYWRTSVRELASEVPLGGRVVCSPYWLEGNAQRFGFDGSHDCASDPVGPLSPYRASRPDGPTLAPDEFYAVSALAQAPPPNCRLVGSVTRTVVLDPVRMSHVARCRLEFPVLGSGTTTFERFPERWRFPLRRLVPAPGRCGRRPDRHRGVAPLQVGPRAEEGAGRADAGSRLRRRARGARGRRAGAAAQRRSRGRSSRSGVRRDPRPTERRGGRADAHDGRAAGDPQVARGLPSRLSDTRSEARGSGLHHAPG